MNPLFPTSYGLNSIIALISQERLWHLYIYIYIHELRKILTDNTTILETENNKQKLLIIEALHIRNMQPTLNGINFQTSANVLECLKVLTLFIEIHLKANAIFSNSKDALT